MAVGMFRAFYSRMLGGLVPALVTAAALAPPASGQNAIEELNRILGRDQGSQERPGLARPPSPRARTDVRSGLPPPASSSPGGGSVGHVDLPLQYRLHPVMRLLQVPSKAGTVPYFAEKDEVVPLVPSKTWLEARRRRVEEARSTLAEIRTEIRALQQKLNSMPRSASEAVNALPRGASAARRKEEEERFHQRRADTEAQIQRLQTAVFELEGKLQPDSAEINSTAMRRIESDVAVAVAEVAQRQGVGVVLNLPLGRPVPEAIDLEPGRRRLLVSEVTRNQNWLSQFFEAPLRRPLDRHLLGTYLAKWEGLTHVVDRVLPEEVWQPSVVYGGVDVNGPVLRAVWEKYKVPEARIRAGERFVETRGAR